MTYIVMSSPASLAAFLPPSDARRSGGGRMYHLFTANGRPEDMTFVDPCDGETVLDARAFDTLGDAERWITHDIALRAAATSGVQ